jgi:hypothetical protein
MMAGVTGNFDPNAACQTFIAQISPPGPGGHHQVNGVAFGTDAQFAAANPAQRPQVARFKLVGTNHGYLCLHDVIECKWNFHSQNFGAVQKALSVVLQPENCRALIRFVSTNPLKNTAAIMQGVGQHMNICVSPIHQLAIHPDFSITIRQGRRGQGRGHGVVLSGESSV